MGRNMHVALVVAVLLSASVGFDSSRALAQTPSGGTTTSVACIDGTSAASAALCNAYHGGLAITTKNVGSSGSGDTGAGTGARTYFPLKVTKEIGAATPLIGSTPPSGANGGVAAPGVSSQSTLGAPATVTDKVVGPVVKTPPPSPPPPCVKDPTKPTSQRVCPPPEPKKE